MGIGTTSSRSHEISDSAPDFDNRISYQIPSLLILGRTQHGALVLQSRCVALVVPHMRRVGPSIDLSG